MGCVTRPKHAFFSCQAGRVSGCVKKTRIAALMNVITCINDIVTENKEKKTVLDQTRTEQKLHIFHIMDHEPDHT
ncbi:hypothetical protein Hanom_Chr04g00347741 [Helianthus anomalus]